MLALNLLVGRLTARALGKRDGHEYTERTGRLVRRGSTMSDRYASFAASGPGRALVKRLGLPEPPSLRRYRSQDPVVPGPVLIGGEGRLSGPIGKALGSIGAELRPPSTPHDQPVPHEPSTSPATSAGVRAV